MLCTSSTYLIIFASLLFNHVNLIYLETFSCVGMASSKGTTAELDSVICVRVDRPARMDSLKPKGSFCKVLAVVEVRMGKVEVKVKGDRVVQWLLIRYSLLRTRERGEYERIFLRADIINVLSLYLHWTHSFHYLLNLIAPWHFIYWLPKKWHEDVSLFPTKKDDFVESHKFVLNFRWNGIPTILVKLSSDIRSH